jgi:hypothetical protein
LRQRQEIQALLRPVIESGASGKTGGLREREPLKAVVVYHEAFKAPPVQLFEAFAFFFPVVSMIFKFCIASYSQAY